jgi:formylmethanofuran dehydrogenase subunit B
MAAPVDGYTPGVAPIIENVACTVCGCVCDDLRVRVESGRLEPQHGACELALPWYRARGTRTPPAALVDGRPASLDEAAGRAADILRAARSPLIYGLSRSTTEGQRSALALADRLGATIDTTASLGHAPAIMALQESGESTCTLGEVRHRADLVIYWASDPLRSHPRHIERYATRPDGSPRTLIVADSQPTATSAVADRFIPVAAGRDFEAFWALRAMLRGEQLADGAELGVAPGLLADLAKRMKGCRFGIVFFGRRLSQSRDGHRTIEALLRLVDDLNDHTRFYARRMRTLGDVAGADSVLCWQTGFPFAVNLARGFPRYNPGEFSAAGMLARGEADACVLVGSESLAEFPPAALDHLRQIPVVTLDTPEVDAPVPAAVRFTTAVYGVHRPGTAYRMDEVPVPLQVLLDTDYPSDRDVLDAVLRRIG